MEMPLQGPRRHRRAARDLKRTRLSPLRLFIIAVAFEITSFAAHAAAPSLTSVVIEGSSVYGAAQLFDVYAGELGKPMTRDTAQAVVLAVAAHYESDGYARPQVQVGAALAEFGVLHVDVLEPRITRVEIKGDPGPHRSALERIAADVVGQAPLRKDELAKELARARELPGLTLKASTARDDAMPGAYVLALDTAFDRVSGLVRFTNRGTDEVGPEFLLGQVVTHGLAHGRATVGVLFGAATQYSEYRGIGVLAAARTGDAGGKVTFTAFRSRAQPHEVALAADLRYGRDTSSLRFTRPVHESGARTLSFGAGLDLDDLLIQFRGMRLRDERLRMLVTGAYWRGRAGPSVEYAASAEIVRGLGGLGSRLQAADLATDPRREDFTLAKLSYTRLSRFASAWSLRLDAFAQKSGDVLPYTQQFKIGGDRLGRGFDVARVAGDSGLGAKIELRRRLPGAPAALSGASLYGFYDAGAAWRENASDRASASTTGIGFAVQNGKTSAYVEAAEPLTQPRARSRIGRSIFVELTRSF
jgi:hemolysin activation/secretion protein